MPAFPKIAGLHEETSDGETTTYALTTGTLTVASLPHYPEFTAHAGAVSTVARALGPLEKMRVEVANDKTLTPLGKRQRLEPLIEKARAAVSQAQGELAAFKEAIGPKEERLYAPPKLAKDDYVSATTDAEIRSWARSLPDSRRDEIAEAMEADPRVLEALLRSPISFGMLSDAASRLWRGRIDPSNSLFVDIERHREASKWAEDQVYWLAKHIEGGATSLTDMDRLGQAPAGAQAGRPTLTDLDRAAVVDA